MIASGAFDLARSELDWVTVPTNTSDGLQLDGMLALSRALVAASDKRPGDMQAPLEHAAQLAERTGQGNGISDGFRTGQRGPVAHGRRVGGRGPRYGRPGRGGLAPAGAPQPRTPGHLLDGLRAGTGPRRRRDDAVRALRTAEELLPMRVLRVLRNPFARDVIAELVVHCRRDSVGRELRGMAYRAGLPVQPNRG
jgi:hypothetical protein